jgi:hypothetical protein
MVSRTRTLADMDNCKDGARSFSLLIVCPLFVARFRFSRAVLALNYVSAVVDETFVPDPLTYTLDTFLYRSSVSHLMVL